MIRKILFSEPQSFWLGLFLCFVMAAGYPTVRKSLINIYTFDANKALSTNPIFMKITVLGAGMIGRTIAKDLAKKHQVKVVDRDQKNLILLEGIKNLETVKVNLSSLAGYKKLLAGQDVCVCAVPGFMGYEALSNIIQAGTNCVDISFAPENALALDELAKKHKVTVVIDCGVAPGMSNMILGYEDTQMKVDSFTCVVGGLPKIRTAPFEYKAPFSPIDVIEEYSRPARLVENSVVVTKPALSEREILHFKEVGSLESFNTDGLRSLIESMPHIPHMKEKTLRYPGHIALIQSLQQAGFFSNEKIMVDGSAISRKDFTCKILFDQWKLEPEDEEFTLMQINIAGTKNGKKIEKIYNVFDEYDRTTKTSSMSRTTAFTCTAVVDLMTKGKVKGHGVFAPEIIAAGEGNFEAILDYLKERGVLYTLQTS